MLIKMCISMQIIIGLTELSEIVIIMNIDERNK